MSAIAEAFVRLRPDLTGFKQEAQLGLAGQLSGLSGGEGLLGIGKNALRASAGIIGITTAATAGAVALREIVVGAAETEQQLDVLAVVSGATADEMERISETARTLGADVTLPGISAGDAAVAMNELAKAGLNLQDTVGGARGVLQLAAAGELEVRDAAALAGSALNAFGLAGDKAGHVADLLAGASVAAQGEVSDMGLALQQSGAVARQAGLSIEQTVGAIALLAKNGILGSDAGTSLRTTLLRLIPTTKEAAQFTKALGIEIDGTKTLGEQLPQVIEQYRTQLSKLSPELQQVALTQIFGSDAIRAAAIFAREGAAGYQAMTNSVNKAGSANELATARTQGLIGTFEGLKSQLSTLAESIGEELIPGLTEITEGATGVVGAFGDIIQTAKDLNAIKLPDWMTLPGFGGQDDANNDDDDIGWLKRPVDFIKDNLNTLVGYENEIESLRDSMSDLRSPDVIDRAQVVQDAKVTGREVGNQFTSEVAESIKSGSELAVDAARETVKRVAEQGRNAIQQAIASAQQNLASIGSSLASDVSRIIDATVEQGVDKATKDTGAAAAAGQRRRQQEAIQKASRELDLAVRNVPIMREIERLQKQLDQENRAGDRVSIGRGIRDAQEELALARRQAQTAGPLDAGQVAATRKFLRPFEERVQDARGELRKFNTEGRLDTLQKRLADQTDGIADNIARLKTQLQTARDALIASQASFSTEGVAASLRQAATEQKNAITTGIDDSIQAFNDGLITLPELNRRLAKLLSENGVDYRNAGKLLGTAFLRGFEEKLKGIGVQARDILAGPQDPGAGIRADTVVPAAVARTARLNNQDAQRALQAALVTQGEETNSLLKRIADSVDPRDKGLPKGRVGDSAADKANTAVQARPGRPSTTAPTKKAVRRRLHDPPEE